ncbi:hypothetical protein GCM10023188_03760 [Pontibacter saemangeumensis]|uniref:Uncharacterized protein n=1 Tax=Pontibacter saemangeumensis TaxID=1084525 RepID=A0ABP8L783_9BACT
MTGGYMRLTLYSRVEIVAERTLLLLRCVMVVGMPVVLVSVVLRLVIRLVEMLVRHDAVHQYQRIGKKGKQQQGDLL